MKLALFYLFFVLFTFESSTFANQADDSSFDLQMEDIEQIGITYPNIGDLPEELLINIAERLDAQGLVRLSRTNKEFLAFMMRNKFYFEELETLILLSDRIAVEQNPAEFLKFSEAFTRRLYRVRTDRNLNLSFERFNYLTEPLILKNDKITLNRIADFVKTPKNNSKKYISDFLILLGRIRKDSLSHKNKNVLNTLISEILKKEMDRLSIDPYQNPLTYHLDYNYRMFP
ncbi:MAG: F-box protein [Bdellovibrionia bacterium]